MGLPILGIDIAKDKYVVTLLHNEKRQQREFTNRPVDFKRLQAWLNKHNVPKVHACLEATGRYGDALAQWLYDQGHTVSVVNPLRIKSYARARLTRNKTDQVDADLIADFCQSEQPAAWTPPTPEMRELQELLHQYDALQAARTQVLNRLASGFTSPVVVAQLQKQREFLENQLAELVKLIQDHIHRHPDLKREHDLVASITGIGDLTAAKIVAANPSRFEDARAFAAFVGVTPMQFKSGSSVHRQPRLSKIGDANLRHALYMPALSAWQSNPIIKKLIERLLARGKTKMTVVGAVMHKLLVLAYGVLKSGQPFDPHYRPLLVHSAT
jgi:transposase